MIITVNYEDGTKETFNNSSTFTVKQSMLADIEIKVTVYIYKEAEETPEPIPTPDSNIIANCTEAGKDENGNNVCKVCASGYVLENNQCVKSND